MASPALVCLPTSDRKTTFDFYRAGLGLDAFGPLADDGVPEPLQFVVNDGLHLMFIPTGGFDWVTGEHCIAPRGTSECLISLELTTTAEVDRAFERAITAGATVLQTPIQQPWGYLATFADPDSHLWQLITTP